MYYYKVGPLVFDGKLQELVFLELYNCIKGTKMFQRSYCTCISVKFLKCNKRQLISNINLSSFGIYLSRF